MSVETIFRNLVASNPDMKLREGQIKLSTYIEESLKSDTGLIAQAGTGVGKSNAYIVPILLSHKKVTISTATKALQDQIFFKDLPNMMELLGVNKKVMLYKGAGNYLCLEKLYATSLTDDSGEANRLNNWYENSMYGDLNEYDEKIQMGWSNINVDSEHCLASGCNYFESCKWMKMMEQIEKADIIITNHHLLLYAPVCKKDRHIIIDEAHELADIAANVYSLEISDKKLMKVIGDLSRYSDEHLYKVGLSKAMLSHLQNVFNRYAMRVAQISGGQNSELLSTDFMKDSQGIINSATREKIMNYSNKYKMEYLSRMARYILSVSDFISTFNSHRTDIIRYVIRKKGDDIAYKIALRDIGPYMSQFIYNLASGVCLLSATLKYNNSFAYSRGKLGVKDLNFTELEVSSPFDYPNQALIYTPEELNEENVSSHPDVLAAHISRVINLMKGRTLVLFTSYKMMTEVYEKVAHDSPYSCLMQGQYSNPVLQNMFLNDKNSVLFGTKSFWTGIDIPSESLSCVIIDKIPFPQLGDPLVKGKEGLLTNFFAQYLLPEASLSLCQGVGRLIRRESDKGLIVLLDSRLQTRQYSRHIFNSLPNLSKTDKFDEVKDWLTAREVI